GCRDARRGGGGGAGATAAGGLLEAETPRGAREPRDHPHALLAETRDLALECDQVLLRAVRLLRELGELGREAVHLGDEPVAPADQRERRCVIVALDGDVELPAHVSELRGVPLELLRELAAE